MPRGKIKKKKETLKEKYAKLKKIKDLSYAEYLVNNLMKEINAKR